MTGHGLRLAVLVILAAPLAAQAQQAGKIPRIGMLSFTTPGTEEENRRIEVFKTRTARTRYVQGQNIRHRAPTFRRERRAPSTPRGRTGGSQGRRDPDVRHEGNTCCQASDRDDPYRDADGARPVGAGSSRILRGRWKHHGVIRSLRGTERKTTGSC